MALKHLPSYISFLPVNLRKRAMEMFAYTAQVIPLAGAAGTVVNVTVPIQNDADFLFCALTGTARDPAALQTVFPNPAVTLLINDSGSGRNVFQQATDWANVVGTAQLPGDWPYPYFCEKGGELTLTFTNLAAQAYDIRLALQGFKIFRFDADINQGG